MKLNQLQLQKKVKIYVTSGKRPEAQAVINPTGSHEEKLNEGETLLDRWLALKANADKLREEQKGATQAEKQARKTAAAEVSSLKEAVRVLWGQDETMLARFAMTPYQYGNRNGKSPAPDNSDSNGSKAESTAETPTETNGSKPRSDQPTTTAERIAYWHMVYAVFPKLSEEQQAQLAGVGWNAQRVAAGANLVDVYAKRDELQDRKIKQRQQARAAATEAEKELRTWYGQARRLTRSAIRRSLPPEKRQAMEELLGL